MNNYDDNNSFSRMEIRKKHRNHKLVAILLITILVVIGLSALAYGMISSPSNNDVNSNGNQTTSSSSSVVSSSSSSKSKKAAKSSSSMMSSSSSMSSNSASTVSKDKEQNNSNAASASSQASSTNNNTQSSHENSGYAVIGQDGMTDLYQVSRRYGVSVQDLMKINGLNNENHVTANQKIRVR